MQREVAAVQNRIGSIVQLISFCFVCSCRQFVFVIVCLILQS